jgi:4a-hydroxytetrahydrobiopterin dehydratase
MQSSSRSYTNRDDAKEKVMKLDELRQQNCKPLKGKENAIPPEKARQMLTELPGWEFGDGEDRIEKTYKFPDFAKALAFVNDVGSIAERENHHPDVELGWGKAVIKFSTHDVGGLSMNDFISAAKVESIGAK